MRIMYARSCCTVYTNITNLIGETTKQVKLLKLHVHSCIMYEYEVW